jgi:hypothetical protein
MEVTNNILSLIENSPACDLLQSSGFNGLRTTTFNGQAEPKMKDIVQIANELSLSKKTRWRNFGTGN